MHAPLASCTMSVQGEYAALLYSTLQHAQRCCYNTSCDTEDHIGHLNAMRMQLEAALELCWNRSSGPVPPSLAGQSCKTASAQMSANGLISVFPGSYIQLSSGIGRELAKLPARYVFMLTPFLTLHLIFHVCKSRTSNAAHLLKSNLFPSILSYLLTHGATCEVCTLEELGLTVVQAETFTHLWISLVFADGDLDLASKRSIEIRSLTRSHRMWLRAEVKGFFQNDPKLAIGWLHPNVLELFTDEPFAKHCRALHIMNGSKAVMSGLLGIIEATTETTESEDINDIPSAFLYDQLAREIARRVHKSWTQSKKEASAFAKHRHEQYLLQMTFCVSQYALHNDAPLLVIAIELSILSMICLSTQHSTVHPTELLYANECTLCKNHTHGQSGHGELTKLIQMLYQLHDGVTLQSISDSPQSSPLRALSTDGLDLGHTFMLVSKMMKWHALALPEAQALSVCSKWMSPSQLPCSREFFRRISSMQADAENRALCNLSPNRSGYVYDDIVDAYVLRDSSIPNMSPVQQENRPLYNPQVSSIAKRKLTECDASPTVKARVPLSSRENDDELDLLTNTSVLASSRVCRRVKRFDVGQENTRQQTVRGISRRKSLLPYL